MKKLIAISILALIACAPQVWGYTNPIESNTVEVVTTLWDLDFYPLYVGQLTEDNGMSVVDGGRVRSASGYIGWDAGSFSNWVEVIGFGSSWSNDYGLSIGEYGSGNRLDIAGGGLVRNQTAYIGAIVGSSNNTVTVSGSNSLWYSSNALYVDSISNKLFVTNGGNVHSGDGYIGASETATNGMVVISGSGSSWTNSDWLAVGYGGTRNLLSIYGGATVQSESGALGYYESSSGNTVLVDGAGSVWENTQKTYAGYYGHSNTLHLSGGGRLLTGDGYVGYYESAANNTAVVSGHGSLWSNSFWFAVGEFGSGNRLSILAGGEVQTAYGYIGYYESASNNVVEVSGSGSTWSNVDMFVVGEFGSGNSLSITAGGEVHCYSGLIGSSNNVVQVDGMDSTWDARYLNVAGTGNQLIVGNGGSVQAYDGALGFDSSNNLVQVIGANSQWSNTLYMTIGGGTGHGNRLEVDDFGRVTAQWAVVHPTNTVALGPGSLLESSYSLTLHASSRLKMGISDRSGTGHGKLTTGSNSTGLAAALDGTLEVVFLGGFMPTSATVYDLFDWNKGVSGNFSTVLLPALPIGFTWNTNNLYSDGTLAITGSFPDIDLDGLPDFWELDYFNDPTNAAPTGHGDADPHDNLSEYIAGTDPTNSGSYFHITNAVPIATGFLVEWTPSVSNRWYSVLWTNGLGSGFTSLVSGIDFPQNSYTDTVHNASDASFYQIEVQLK